ncbi:hypothetical protein, partial [Shigella sonnei]
FSGPKTSIICTPMTSLKTSIKTITYLSDTGCLEIQGASLGNCYDNAPMESFWGTLKNESLKWHTEFGHLNRGDMLTSEQHRCSNEKKKF